MAFPPTLMDDLAFRSTESNLLLTQCKIEKKIKNLVLLADLIGKLRKRRLQYSHKKPPVFF